MTDAERDLLARLARAGDELVTLFCGQAYGTLRLWGIDPADRKPRSALWKTEDAPRKGRGNRNVHDR